MSASNAIAPAQNTAARPDINISSSHEDITTYLEVFAIPSTATSTISIYEHPVGFAMARRRHILKATGSDMASSKFQRLPERATRMGNSTELAFLSFGVKQWLESQMKSGKA